MRGTLVLYFVVSRASCRCTHSLVLLPCTTRIAQGAFLRIQLTAQDASLALYVHFKPFPASGAALRDPGGLQALASPGRAARSSSG